MSIARAMSRRLKRNHLDDASAPPVPSLPTRSKTVIDRSKISGPVALVSTTNLLSYNAPDVVSFRKQSVSNAPGKDDDEEPPSSDSPSTASFKKQPSMSALSGTDAEDSDHSTSTRSRASSHASRDTFTDASSVSSSPTSPGPNHLNGFFASASKKLRKSVSSGNLQQLKETVEEDLHEPVPAIPERALSHSKRAHENLARKRSLQSMSRCSSVRSSREQRASADMFSATIMEDSHPFGKELEQLSEVVEEYGDVVRDAAMESDLAIMRERNLASFCAADYLAEIQPLYEARFETATPMAWI